MTWCQTAPSSPWDKVTPSVTFQTDLSMTHIVHRSVGPGCPDTPLQHLLAQPEVAADFSLIPGTDPLAAWTQLITSLHAETSRAFAEADAAAKKRAQSAQSPSPSQRGRTRTHSSGARPPLPTAAAYLPPPSRPGKGTGTGSSSGSPTPSPVPGNSSPHPPTGSTMTSTPSAPSYRSRRRVMM